MAPASQGSVGPSLTRLNGLDKDYPDIGCRLRAAAQIAGISQFAPVVETASYFSRSRAAWVLRWLTEKLKPGKKEEGPPFRASPLTWHLLQATISQLPLSNLTTVLTNAAIFQSIELSLGEWLHDSQSLRNSQEMSADPAQHSKKRKRNDIDSAKQNPSNHNASLLQQRLDAMLLCITQMRKRADENVDDSSRPSQERLKLLLRMDARLAATLFGLGMTSLVRLRQMEGYLSIQNIDALASVWRARSVLVADEISLATLTFAEECLVPTCLLYGSLLQQRNTSHGELEATVIRKLERLLVDNIIRPAHAIFGDNKSNVGTGKSEAGTLRSRMSSLQEAIGFLANSKADQEQMALVAAAAEFFKLAAQNSDRSTPKQRLRERPWLENVFQTCMECVPSIGSSEDAFEAELEMLLKLLCVATTAQFKLTASYEENLISRYSGLRSAKPNSRSASPNYMQWSLVKYLLDMDADALVETKTTAVKTPSEAGSLPDALAYHISNTTQYATGGEGQHQYSAGQKNATTIVSDVVMSLLQAHARRMQSRAFIDIWFSELGRACSQLSADELRSSPWTNASLVSLAGTEFQNSLSAAQVMELFDTIFIPSVRTALKDFDFVANGTSHEQTDSSDHISRLYAVSVILEAVLHGSLSQDIVVQMTSRITDMLRMLQDLAIANPPNLLLASNMWKVMALLWQLQRRSQPGSLEFRKTRDSLLKPATIKEAIKSVERNSRSNECVTDAARRSAFILLITIYAHDLDQDRENLARCSNLYLCAIATTEHNDRRKSEIIQRCVQDLQIMASNAHLLSSIDHQSRLDMFARILQLITGAKQAMLDLTGPTNEELKPHLLAFQDALSLFADRQFLDSWIESLLVAITKFGTDRGASILLTDMLLALRFDSLSKAQADVIATFCIDKLSIGRRNNAALLATLLGLVRNCRSTLSFMHDPSALLAISAQIFDTAKCDVSGYFEQLITAVLSSVRSLSDPVKVEAFYATLDDGLQKAHSLTIPGESFSPTDAGFLRLLELRILFGYNHVLTNTVMAGNSAPGVPDSLLAKLLPKLETAANRYTKVSETSDALDLSPSLSKLLLMIICLCKGIKPSDSSIQERMCALDVKGLSSLVLVAQPNGQLNGLNGSDLFSPSVLARNLTEDRFFHVMRSLDPFCSRQTNPSATMIRGSQTPFNTVSTTQLGSLQKGATLDECKLRSSSILEVKRSSFSDEQHEETKRVLPLLAIDIMQTQSIHVVGYALNDVRVIIEKKPFMISQYGIETVLNTISNLLLSERYSFLSEYSSPIYLRLCQILYAILSFSRKSVTGRMHILIPSIQGLLNPLFIKHSSSKISPTQGAPAWASSSKATWEASHAIACTKVLLALTQPTVTSAASRYKGGANPLLTDETRKARQYAARFVPYIISHFCSLLLIGHLKPEVRKALLPGIWACIEVVPHDGLRGMNATLNREQRAIWTSLYAEWTRTRSKAS